ncbi:MAG: hypothetical protein Q8Q18_00090 [bacterium]|nr:hypothetical protein [bacterium]
MIICNNNAINLYIPFHRDVHSRTSVQPSASTQIRTNELESRSA